MVQTFCVPSKFTLGPKHNNTGTAHDVLYCVGLAQAHPIIHCLKKFPAIASLFVYTLYIQYI